MKIEGRHLFKATRERTWDLLTSPEALQASLPGCRALEERGPGEFDVTLSIGIAAVKGEYRGVFRIVDAEIPERFRLVGEGSGTSGFVKGETLIELAAQDDDTLVTYAGDVEIGGLIAGVGQRIVGGIAKIVAGQFFKNMENLLAPPPEQGNSRP